jgi:NAD(P)-dependent dehydrogenase (short-subunit alcohol dehydrogenase family)
MKNFAGACAVITGASGLGRGMAAALAERETHLVIADYNLEAAETTAHLAESHGVRAIAVRTDVSDAGAMQRLADRAYAEFGSVQLLVNNAAVYLRQPIWEVAPEDWRWILSINVEGPANSLRAFVPCMLAQEGERHIVITSSQNGLWTMPGQGAYNTTKYALMGLGEALAAEVSGHGVQVSLVCPGPMVGEMGRNSKPPSLKGESAQMKQIPDYLQAMIDSWGALDRMEAGRIVVRGIERGELYILTHTDGWDLVDGRHQQLAEAYDHAKSYVGAPK